MLGERGQMEKDKYHRILKKEKHRTIQKHTHGCRQQIGVTGGDGRGGEVGGEGGC